MKKALAKRAILFTIFTLILLSSIFYLTNSYLKRNRQTQDFISQSARSSDIRFIGADIVSDYFSLLGIKLESIKRTNAYLQVSFSNFSSLRYGQNWSSLLSNYTYFITGKYANLTNKVININNLNTKIYFFPYNSTFLLFDDKLYFYGVRYSYITDVSITIKVNESDVNLLSTSDPATEGGSNPKISVMVLDHSNNVLMNKNNIKLTPYGTHTQFTVRFNKSSYSPNVTVNWGNITEVSLYGPSTEYNGSLRVRATRLTANITGFEVRYILKNQPASLQTEATIDIG